MATQAEESAPSPQLVANAFVENYYNLLNKSPDMAHKFYQDQSVISRPDADGSMLSASTLNGINEMICSFEYKNCAFEILTADAQASFGNGVIVLVTGLFTAKDNVRRQFTQLFFLAPQEIGGCLGSYFVLNDVLRYVTENVTETITIIDADETAPAAPVTPDPEPTSSHSTVDLATPPLQDTIDQAKDSSYPLDDGKIPIDDKEVASGHLAGTIQNDADPGSGGTSQNVSSPVSETEASNNLEDAPKKSYASVLRQGNDLNLPKPRFQQRVQPAKPAKLMEQSHATVAPAVSPRPSSNNTVEQNNNPSVKGYSIFVANLPMDATVDQLVGTFKQFGPIKPNGVQVRSYKLEKNCFGFVEFESADSMESALQVKSIMIGDRKAHIEPKRANNDGGKYPLRRGGFRNENFENRGNFGGGRGHGRNEFENRGGSSGQARGTNERSGEANQKFHHNGGGRGRRQAQAQAQGGKN